MNRWFHSPDSKSVCAQAVIIPPGWNIISCLDVFEHIFTFVCTFLWLRVCSCSYFCLTLCVFVWTCVRLWARVWLWWWGVLQGCWSSDHWACQSLWLISFLPLPPSFRSDPPSPSPPTPSTLVINHSVGPTGSSDIIQFGPSTTTLKETHWDLMVSWVMTTASPAVPEVIILTFSLCYTAECNK